MTNNDNSMVWTRDGYQQHPICRIRREDRTIGGCFGFYNGLAFVVLIAIGDCSRYQSRRATAMGVGDVAIKTVAQKTQRPQKFQYDFHHAVKT